MTDNVQTNVLINTSKEEPETAKEGSQVQHPEIQNPEVNTIINKVKKRVLNDTFKENERSNVPCTKVMADLNPMIPFQNLSSNKDMNMEDTSNTMKPGGGQDPIPDRPGEQAWPCYPDQADQFPGGPRRSSSYSNIPGALPGKATQPIYINSCRQEMPGSG